MPSTTNPNGVTYDLTLVSNFPFPNTYDLTITYPAGGGSPVVVTGIPVGNVVLGGTSGTVGGLALIGTNTFVIAPGATGTVEIGASVLANTTVYVGGTATLDIVASAASTSTIEIDGGNASLAAGVVAGALGHTTVDLNNHGDFTVSPTLISALNGATIDFGTNGGTAIVGGSSDALLDLSGTTFESLTNSSDIIDDTSLGYASGINHYTVSGPAGGTQTVEVFANDGSSFYFTVSGGPSNLTAGTYTSLNGPLFFSSDGSGGTDITVCFLAGTRLATSDGERPVETLQAGDMVATRLDGGTVYRPIKWLGWRRIDLTAHPRPQTVAPVRIQRGAFADNLPANDLLLSPDHAVFIDGKLICARQLVNGSTIRQETNRSVVEYFHVELDTHAILLSEGLPTESYLDTGNRGFFANADQARVLHPDLTDESSHPDRAAASCAPFVWAEEDVRPVWNRLAERAAALGSDVVEPEGMTDPQLCIVVRGQTQRPLAVANGCYHFIVKSGVEDVLLVSRAASPSRMRPWLNDRRQLGVNIERIVLRRGCDMQDIPVDHPGLSQGWWPAERDGLALRRWTNGRARLTFPAHDRPAILEIWASNGGMIYATDAADQHRAA